MIPHKQFLIGEGKTDWIRFTLPLNWTGISRIKFEKEPRCLLPGAWHLTPGTCTYSLLGLVLAGSLGLLEVSCFASFFSSFFSTFFSVDGEESPDELLVASDDFFA